MRHEALKRVRVQQGWACSPGARRKLETENQRAGISGLQR